MTALLLLAACASPAKIKRIHVPSDQGTIALCPGENAAFKVNARMRNGQRKTTTGRGRNKLPWKHLRVELDGVPQPAGRLLMPQDPHTSWKRPLELKVWLDDRPKVSWEGQVVARYDCAYYLDLRGAPGMRGDSDMSISAEDGEDGRDRGGERGGPGRRGQDGRHGAHGGHAGYGANATVSLTQGEGKTAGLLEARVAYTMGSTKDTLYYLLDPNNGSLWVDVSGGVGGAGEDGQDGGDGGDGGDGTPSGPGGQGGDGGDGGSGGDGGVGGSLELLVDAGAERYADRITLQADGGPAGPGGAGGDAGDGGDGSPEGEPGREGRRGNSGRPGRPGELLPSRVTPVTPRF
ncbi:MAG: hypothetical protein VX899_06960 [Myxococcota bacterium]|nr:hypothetical protein [Myxococcota bacterium]